MYGDPMIAHKAMSLPFVIKCNWSYSIELNEGISCVRLTLKLLKAFSSILAVKTYMTHKITICGMFTVNKTASSDI